MAIDGEFVKITFTGGRSGNKTELYEAYFTTIDLEKFPEIKVPKLDGAQRHLSVVLSTFPIEVPMYFALKQGGIYAYRDNQKYERWDQTPWKAKMEYVTQIPEVQPTSVAGEPNESYILTYSDRFKPCHRVIVAQCYAITNEEAPGARNIQTKIKRSGVYLGHEKNQAIYKQFLIHDNKEYSIMDASVSIVEGLDGNVKAMSSLAPASSPLDFPEKEFFSAGEIIVVRDEVRRGWLKFGKLQHSCGSIQVVGKNGELLRDDPYSTGDCLTSTAQVIEMLRKDLARESDPQKREMRDSFIRLVEEDERRAFSSTKEPW